MLGGLVRLILLRVVGARVLLGIAVFEWLRRALAGRRVGAVGRRRPNARTDAAEPQPR